MPAADVAFRLEAVQFDGLVVVGKGLEGIAEEEPGRAPVEVGSRIRRLLADVAVEVCHGALETACQEVGDSAAVVQADEARTQFYGLFQVFQGCVVFALAALGDGAVVPAVGEHRIDAYRTVEVGAGAADVAEVVFGDTAEEEVPVVRGVEPGQNVEVLYGEGVFAVLQGGAATEEENVAVVLGVCRDGRQENKYCRECFFH